MLTGIQEKKPTVQLVD